MFEIVLLRNLKDSFSLSGSGMVSKKATKGDKDVMSLICGIRIFRLALVVEL